MAEIREHGRCVAAAGHGRIPWRRSAGILTQRPKHSFEESLAFMPLVRFTQNIQRHVPCPPRSVSGQTVRAALEAYFLDHPDPGARGYVLDDQGRLRKHMMIFVAGRVIADRVELSDVVAEDGTIDVMQALSGG